MKKIFGFLLLKENQNNVYRIWKVSLKHKYLLIFAMFTLILDTFQTLFIPIKINDFTKIFSSEYVSNTFFDSTLYYFFLFISLNLIDTIHDAAVDIFSLSLMNSMMEYFVKSLFTKDIEFFDKNKTSDLFSLLTNDIINLSDTSILGFFDLFKTITKGVGSLLLMLYFYFKLTCLLILIIPIILFINNKRVKQSKKDQQNLREQRNGTNHIFMESLENIKTVKAFSTEDKEINKFQEQLQKMCKNLFNYLMKMTISKNIISIIFFGLILLIIRLGIYFAKKETEKNPDFTKNLMAFMIYCIMFMSTFNEFSNKYERIQKSLIIAEKVFKVIDYDPVIKNLPENKYSYMSIEGNIEFKNIDFSYPTKKEVEILKNFNLKIDKGTCIGIVGASGSGKSTIVNLIQRLYNCGSNIYINKNNMINISNNLDSEYIELPNISMNSNNTNLDEQLIDSDFSLLKINQEEEKELNKENKESENSCILIDNINLKYLDIKHYLIQQFLKIYYMV